MARSCHLLGKSCSTLAPLPVMIDVRHILRRTVLAWFEMSVQRALFGDKVPSQLGLHEASKLGNRIATSPLNRKICKAWVPALADKKNGYNLNDTRRTSPACLGGGGEVPSGPNEDIAVGRNKWYGSQGCFWGATGALSQAQHPFLLCVGIVPSDSFPPIS